MAQINSAVTECPGGLAWCTEHIGDLHQHRVAEAGGQLQVVMELPDQGGAPEIPALSFRFCADGELIDESTEVDLGSILNLLGLRIQS